MQKVFFNVDEPPRFVDNMGGGMPERQPYFIMLEGFNASLGANFNFIQARLTQLDASYKQINTANQDLVRQITDLNQRLTASNQALDRISQQQGNLVTSLATIKQQLGRLFSFIPQFVNATSTYFVDLLISMRTGTTETLPSIQYPTLDEQINNP